MELGLLGVERVSLILEDVIASNTSTTGRLQELSFLPNSCISAFHGATHSRVNCTKWNNTNSLRNSLIRIRLCLLAFLTTFSYTWITHLIFSCCNSAWQDKTLIHRSNYWTLPTATETHSKSYLLPDHLTLPDATVTTLRGKDPSTEPCSALPAPLEVGT